MLFISGYSDIFGLYVFSFWKNYAHLLPEITLFLITCIFHVWFRFVWMRLVVIGADKKEKFLWMPVYLFFSYDQQNLFSVKRSVVSKRWYLALSSDYKNPDKQNLEFFQWTFPTEIYSSAHHILSRLAIWNDTTF